MLEILEYFGGEYDDFDAVAVVEEAKEEMKEMTEYVNEFNDGWFIDDNSTSNESVVEVSQQNSGESYSKTLTAIDRAYRNSIIVLMLVKTVTAYHWLVFLSEIWFRIKLLSIVCVHCTPYTTCCELKLTIFPSNRSGGYGRYRSW